MITQIRTRKSPEGGFVHEVTHRTSKAGLLGFMLSMTGSGKNEVAATLMGLPVVADCPEEGCAGKLLLRTNHGGQKFLGCSKWNSRRTPCNYTQQYAEKI